MHIDRIPDLLLEHYTRKFSELYSSTTLNTKTSLRFHTHNIQLFKGGKSTSPLLQQKGNCLDQVILAIQSLVFALLICSFVLFVIYLWFLFINHSLIGNFSFRSFQCYPYLNHSIRFPNYLLISDEQ